MSETLKISEHIRAGAKLRPLARHGFFQVERSGEIDPATGEAPKVIASCSLGALAESAGLVDGLLAADILKSLALVYIDPDKLFQKFPELNNTGYDCPRIVEDCKYSSTSLGTIIFHLNDQHKWTREQVADWVESVGL